MKKLILILSLMTCLIATSAFAAQDHMLSPTRRALLNERQVVQQKNQKILILESTLKAEQTKNATLKQTLTQAKNNMLQLSGQLQAAGKENSYLKDTNTQASSQAVTLQSQLQNLLNQQKLKASLYPLMTTTLIKQSNQYINCIRGACFIAPSVAFSNISKVTITKQRIDNYLQSPHLTPMVFIALVSLLLLITFIIGSVYTIITERNRRFKVLGYGAIAGEDIQASQLDLAHAYINMQDHKSAKKVLKQVIKKGEPSQVQEAKQLLSEINDANSTGD